ncbi:MAG: pilus (MSHA type) biogenesis protein MshL [Sulfurovaceae bacterium]|nr:pilus (MSHA type) biogenesis protein MshL [Sulfurovaceae bacterium]
MRKDTFIKKILTIITMFAIFSGAANAGKCDTRLFSVTADSKLTIGDMIDNLADTCGLTVIVKDEEAKMRMNKKLYYVKLKNTTMRGFLNTILKDNDLFYSLDGNKLSISYLVTKTFRVHYIAGERTGKSNAHVTIANSNNSAAALTGGINYNTTNNSNNGSGSGTGMSIESNDEFVFWDTIGKEVQRILIGAGDGSTHYAKTSENSWVGPDGQVWEYNPVAPIINPEAGMITVTGTTTQINRVSAYIDTLAEQIKKQVLIDVRILSVNFDDSRTTGIDWSQIYNLQNMTINSAIRASRNIGDLEYTIGEGITDFVSDNTIGNVNSQGMVAIGSTPVTDIIKFLGTQGNVKSISSPRIMTLNNQPALISVGKELFYKIKSTTSSTSNSGGTIAEGEMVDSVFAGILLDITPEVDDKGMVTLKINPSITDTISTTVSGDGTRTMPPDLVRRQIASVIKVKNGEHAILGGLISSKDGIESDKIPLLGDIPLLGYAFNRERKIKTTEELVLIITPHIIETSKDVLLKDLGYTKLNER